MFPNYYSRLQISSKATREEIKQAYRKLALEFHPDKCERPDAHEKFIEINEAYLILYDLEARVKYDLEYSQYFSKLEDTIKKDNNFTRGKAKSRDIIFEDEDLNDWLRKARSQGTEYSKLSYEVFYKMVLGFVKETGFQLGNTLLMFFGIILIMSGGGNLVFSLITSGDTGNFFFGIILTPIGLVLYFSANKNWQNH